MWLHGERDKELLEGLQNKYLSPEIQNDLIKMMALWVLRDIADKLQKSPFITIMIDEQPI